ncbi:MAG: signal peptidase I [Ruminococcaceae bacterium]|nr:signal peptidase I [Oscillospiraceae bacterium]
MEKKKGTVKKILSILLTILIILYTLLAVVIAVFAFASMKDDNATIFGYYIMYVPTESMVGDNDDSINKGDLILCNKLDSTSDLKVGDVIAFVDYNKDSETFGKTIIHRIVEVTESGYRTKGDNNPYVDGTEVLPAFVKARYMGKRVPVLGSVINFLKSQTGILICMIIPMSLFFIYALYRFIKALLEYKMSKAPAGELSEEQKQKAIEEYLAKQASEAANKEAPAEENSKDNSESDN